MREKVEDAEINLCNCGEAKGFQGDFNRIAGGERVEEGKYPWIVQIRSSLGTCTGALIDSAHVLTAAHCFLGSKYFHNPGERADGNITVTLGTNINFSRGPVLTTVSDYTLHPTWETLDLLGADVAVLTLTSPVQYSDKVKPICLPSNPGQNYVGKVAVASGFGYDVDGNEQRYLMETNVTVISDEECLTFNASDPSNPDWITNDTIRDFFKLKICTKGSQSP